MDTLDRSRSPSRRTSRVEQVVGRWLRRSRDLGSRSHSLGRDRVEVDGKTESTSDQRNHHFRFNVQIQRDPNLNSHGLTLTSQTPILVQDVTPGGPADGRLVPGDQLVKINNVAADDLTPEQAAEIIRECQDTLTMTVLRTMLGPKSSFITPEKRAKLKSNPVKVHFAEEVEVNGHSQGNSLLFLPNVLKVYLENGQTKAFKFDPSTTVKDIVMTLKEKLSLSRIEHFSLVLEQKHSISKLLLLHDEERIQEVVQKKEVHDYRCLFRVYFMPKEPKDLLVEDPIAFEYLYLQGVNDVLQERFAVEMRCNTALRLAALHIQERLAGSGQSPKTNLKTITRTWGIENFVSSTLLRNMREKDLRKAIGFHMKRSQSQHEPKQKGLSVNQARINYLEELCDLKSFGGKSFSATMMLQDRESMVTLLVGARYGVSQVVNHKLSILTTLTEFTSITRIELMPESDRVSLVKIYLQDIKPITLLLESVAAKDMSCLIAGYCRVFVDPNLNIFPWIDDSKKHRVSAEEGYVSRCGSDSDNSDLDMEELVTMLSHDDKPWSSGRCSLDPEGRKKKDRERRRTKDGKENADKLLGDKKEKDEKDADTEKNKSLAHNNREDKDKDTEHKEEIETGTEIQVETTDKDSDEQQNRMEMQKEGQESKTAGEEEVQIAEEQRSVSEASDSCHTDSRILTSPSSDSLDALEEDDLISCSSSSIHPCLDTPLQTYADFHSPLQLHPYSYRHAQPHLLAPPPAHSHPLIQLTTHDKQVDRRGRAEGGEGCRRSGDGADPQLLSPVSTSASLDHMQRCSADPCSEDSPLSFTELSRLIEFLPSPPEASDDEECEEEELRRRRMKLSKEMEEFIRRAGEGGGASEESFREHPLSPTPLSPSSHMEFVFNFNESDARCYYKLCANITPDSARSLPRPQHNNGGEEEQEVEVEVEGDQAKAADLEAIPILQPPPGFGDSSSEEEFYDARDRFTSPEDPTSGTVPRDFCRKMKLDLRSTLSLSDIRVSVADADGKAEANKERGAEAGGGRETLFQLRKRSRKRRSFMETDYTSTVSYPEPNLKSKQDLISGRHQKRLLSQTNDDNLLSSDPEPSKQTLNPCPTVSSLTHCEGEPAQLVSKHILSKPSSHSLSSFGPQGQTRDPPAPSRGKKQEMEMEPDSMESKSVTDLVKVIPPTITVVRYRVDPDGKESTDRRGDGKEEGLGEEEIVKRKTEGEKQESTGVSGNGPVTSHMFLPENIEEGVMREEMGQDQSEEVKGFSSSSKIPLVSSEKQTESNISPVCLMDMSKNNGNDLLSAPEQNLHEVVHMLESVSADLKPLSHSPPPPPPSSPLPPLPVPQKSHSDYRVREESKTMGGSTRMFSSNPEESGESHSPEIPISKHNNKAQPHSEVTTSVIEDEPMGVVSSALTASDEVTDSTNSDNVFDDDEVNNSLNSRFCDNRPVDRNCQTIVRNHTVSDNSATAYEVESQIRITTNTEAHTSSHSDTGTPSVNFDYAGDRSSITANLGTASFTSPTTISGVGLHDEPTEEIAPCSQNFNKPRSDSTMPSVKVEDSFATGRLAKTSMSSIHELSKQPPSQTPFLFPTCSPSIMGRLSASTLRGKIQRLPLYLSRSQESLNKTEVGNVVLSPAQDINRNDTRDVSKTVDLEMATTVESVESDDSDTTVTGSEVDGEIVLETVSAEITQSVVSEVKVQERVMMCPQNQSFAVQTEPKRKHKKQFLNTGLNNNTPGPITEPPGPIVGNLDIQRDITGPGMDIPGPIKDAPESKPKVTSTHVNIPGNELSCESPLSPPPIVITTQNLNGPGLLFHSQPHKVRQTSSEKPLIGLCSNIAQNSDSEKTHSSGCTVFTICKDLSQTTSPAHLGSTTPLKSDFGCSSVLASGCESVVEGVQLPLDACGCPMVYTNCFSRGDSFDDELTVYEFSCHSQSSSMTQTSGSGLPLMTTTPVPSFLSTPTPPFPSSSLSPSFPRSILFSSSASELSPLLSPLLESSDCFPSQTYKDTLSRLGQQQYPDPPAGFQELRADVDQLLSIIKGGGPDHSVIVHGGRHPRDTCPAHFTENNQALHVKARRLMAGCQKVVGIGQSPEEMVHSLADCFQTLVNLAGICLWFSGCDRCDRRNTEAVAGLADVARSFRDFCLAAERASNKRSCKDLSTKLLAKQCTDLTASVFCLTQLFRTLTAL